MASTACFNDVVAHRTATAEYVLGKPDVSAMFEAEGGLGTDLETIRTCGQRAEAFNVMQLTATGNSAGATEAALLEFAGLQRKYASVMAVVQAVVVDLKRQGASPVLQRRVADILRNEAQVVVTTGEAGQKRVKHSQKQEALRAEIAKDMKALLDTGEVLPLLAARKKPPEELRAMLQQAEGLSGLFSEKTAQKGARKTVTAQEREAVLAQREVWAGTYRILTRVAAKDARVAELLKKAAR